MNANVTAAGNGATPVASIMHPAAQKAVAEFSDAMNENASLKLENQELRNELRIARAHCKELEHSVDSEREQKEKFQRYCIRIETLLEGIARAAVQAHEAAVSTAAQSGDVPALANLERQLAASTGK